MLLPNTIIAQTFVLLIAYTLTVVDQYNTPTGRSVNINPSAAERYFRMIACANGDATASAALSEELAAEFLNHLVQRLNNGIAGTVWAAVITDRGFVKITYSGTGTASITWDTNGVIRNILGFTGNLTFTAGQSQTATYQPTHCVFLVGRDTDAPYSHMRQNVAATMTRSGRVVALFGASRPLMCAFDSALHPTTRSHQSSFDIYSTPIEPDRDPCTVSDAAGVAPPWSMFDFFGAAWGHALGALWGTFQNEVSATATVYDLVYLMPDAQEKNGLINKAYIGQQMARGLRFSVKQKGKAL